MLLRKKNGRHVRISDRENADITHMYINTEDTLWDCYILPYVQKT